jgi:ubiquinone/menaquinone biosynthesis C-methylase UbiE
VAIYPGEHLSASTVRNHWKDAKCAKAFWSQHELPPYRALLDDTVAMADPRPGERWLDLGCGQGCLTQAIWERSAGRLAEVIGVDIAPQNAESYARMQDQLTRSAPERIRFVCHDFSNGLGQFRDGSFDHAISGLSISYAESYDPAKGVWTTAAYDQVLAEVLRVLRPGGRFVFSVNVPEPDWLKVGVRSLPAIFHTPKPLRFLKRSLRMLRYGGWLKREARLGRFHYLPHEEVASRLVNVGFVDVKHQLSYEKQAFVFCARKMA